jgi:hypothetical protein
VSLALMMYHLIQFADPGEQNCPAVAHLGGVYISYNTPPLSWFGISMIMVTLILIEGVAVWVP